MSEAQMLMIFFMKASAECSARGWNEAAEYFAGMLVALIEELEARKANVPDGNGSIN